MITKNIKIHFLGAAGTVTGSKYLIDAGERKIMVDCGLFQGLEELRTLNWNYLPVQVTDIDIVLLTHGHLDHVGYLPRLIKTGFKGAIMGTRPTLDIAQIILFDSARIQEEEADRANEEGYSRHKPAMPLYTLQDAEETTEHFKPVDEGVWLDLFDGIRMRFQYAGHILGATFIELDIYGKRLVFSGDVGRNEDVLMFPPKLPEKADVLLIESTYGDRLHPLEDLEMSLQHIVNHTVEKGGTLIIPSFAVERTQTLMYLLWQLRRKKAIPNIPMIMDSPMGANVLDLFQHHREWHKLSVDDCIQMCNFFRIVKDFKETQRIIRGKKSKIVIAGSGMVTGGRVLSYLQHYIEKPQTTVLLAGFQAEGTRGRALLEGASKVKIYGAYYRVKCEVFSLNALSSHADQEGLLQWMGNIENPPAKTYIVHGEPHAADAFRVKVSDSLGWECTIPVLYDIEEIAC